MPQSAVDEIKATIQRIQEDLAAFMASHARCAVSSSQIQPKSPVSPTQSPNITQTTSTPTPPATPQINAFPAMIVKWANAIKRLEGGPDETNPGDLKVSTLTASWGATNGIPARDGGHLAHFKDYNTGFTALCNFLKLGCENELLAFHQARTFKTFMAVYGGNPPQGYIDGIAHDMGIATDTDISTFL